ncbi:MAG: hypothetical protein ACFFA3_17950 [Promethearchaeota archaeon]
MDSKSFKNTFKYICNECGEFSFSEAELCEICGAKAIRKATGVDFRRHRRESRIKRDWKSKVINLFKIRLSKRALYREIISSAFIISVNLFAYSFPRFYIMLGVMVLSSLGIMFLLIQKPRSWVFLHMRVAVFTTIFLIIGSFINFYHKTFSRYVVYVYFSVISTLLLVLGSLIGYIAFKVPKKGLRVVHIGLGGIIFVLLIAVTAYTYLLDL